ncbi:MAG: hypothetical protein E6H66_14100 [Betaproteobacteria bacterium]|nr:MAG: hypothetical protein E6H66_14100 [Betaproteobacteria bacterium]
MPSQRCGRARKPYFTNMPHARPRGRVSASRRAHHETGRLGDYVTETWIGLVAPKGTPDEIVRKLANVVEDAMQAPDLKRRYEVQGWQVVASSPEEFRSVIERDRITWSAIIHRSRIVAKSAS